MRKLLVLARSNSPIDYRVVEKAKQMGVYTYVVCFYPEKCLEIKIADEYWVQDLYDKETMYAKIKEYHIDGIYGGGDIVGSLAMEIAHDCGLHYYCDPETWVYARDKALFKNKCVEYGVPTAKQFYVSENPTENEINSIEYPVVIKPIDCTGNTGFNLCMNASEFKTKYSNAVETSHSGKVVIEHFLQGTEYGAFYVLADGEARLLNFWAMLSQPGTPHNCYELNVSTTDKLNTYLKDVHPNVIRFMEGIGCRDGVVWFEFMADTDGKLYALEMGQRLSGDLMYIPLASYTGFDTLAHLINYAVTGHNDVDSLPASQSNYWKGGACGYILWTVKDDCIHKIVGIDEVDSVEGLQVQQSKFFGDKITAHHYGTIVSITYKDVEDLCEKIKFINKTYHMYNEKGEDLLIYYDQYDFLRELDKKND